MAPKNYDSLRANWKCALACILISLSPFQYGLDFGLIGGIQAMVGFMRIFGYEAPETPIGWNISPEVQQLMGSLMTLGAVVASALAGPLSAKLGRRSCLWIACALCCVSDVLMMATTNLAGLYSGRLLIGLSNGEASKRHGFRYSLTTHVFLGMLMSFSQLWLQECTPAQFRGLALSAFQFWTSAGTLVSPYHSLLAGRDADDTARSARSSTTTPLQSRVEPRTSSRSASYTSSLSSLA